MSASRASLLLYDSYWREFPRKRQMPSDQPREMTAHVDSVGRGGLSGVCMCDEHIAN